MLIAPLRRWRINDTLSRGDIPDSINAIATSTGALMKKKKVQSGYNMTNFK